MVIGPKIQIRIHNMVHVSLSLENVWKQPTGETKVPYGSPMWDSLIATLFLSTIPSAGAKFLNSMGLGYLKNFIIRQGGLAACPALTSDW